MDSNDNVVEQILGMDVDHASEMIVEGIRQHRTSESGGGPNGAALQNGDADVPGFSPNGLGQIPSNTIVLVIGGQSISPVHFQTSNGTDTAFGTLTAPANARLSQDTNWLLSHLPLFEQIEQLVPGGSEAPSPVLFILRK